MRLGQATSKALSTIGITKDRVTAVAQATGLVPPGQDCGCKGREATLDRVGDSIARTIRRYTLRPAEESSYYFDLPDTGPDPAVPLQSQRSAMHMGTPTSRQPSTIWIDGRQYLNLTNRMSVPHTVQDMQYVAQCDGVVSNTIEVDRWADEQGITVVRHDG